MNETSEKLLPVNINCDAGDFEATIESLKDMGTEFVTISAEKREDESIFLIYFFRENKRLISVRLLVTDRTVPSLYSTFGMADFIEREINSLFGIKFIGHPNLERKPSR
ncbi:MAG: NADH-quinone oxidoreductase subunit C [Firmicutes bacterium]|nr:NADH-quinone oxidoreductase subunit C [Bacillota bacterium]